MIIGTAGHIDHGKTALVRALTGIDTDRLEEEKRRGISIDLGFAYLPTSDNILGFVDVPGHERFIHNMLAGITGIDSVMLIVAADDGPMPQTREHLQILHLLGLERGLVALTKIDRVPGERIEEVKAQIQDLLADTTLADIPTFPVSAMTGAGMPALRAHLEHMATQLEVRGGSGYFRLAVDRSFILHGIGTVVTGTVFSGEICVGEKLLVSPAGIEVKLRGMHVQNRVSERGGQGQRCALNLTGPQLHRSAIHRGDWIVHEALHAPSQRLDVSLRLLPTEPKGLMHWTPVHVHLGTTAVMGHIALLESIKLQPGTESLAQLVLDKPVCALRGDRFIVRDQSATRTLGGGLVLDVHAPARRRRTIERLRMLDATRRPTPREALPALLDCTPNGLDVRKFCLNWNLSPEAARGLWYECGAVVRDTSAGEFAFAPTRWTALQQSLLGALTHAHQKAPDTQGTDVRTLRSMMGTGLPLSQFEALAEAMVEKGSVIRNGTLLKLPGHQMNLVAADQKTWQVLLPLLRKGGYSPPTVRELADILKLNEPNLRALLSRLSRMGEVSAITRDRYLPKQTIVTLVSILHRTVETRPEKKILAAEFRDAIGTGRKIAIEILEFFDRSGLTRRIGDIHWLRDKPTDTSNPQSQVKPAPS